MVAPSTRRSLGVTEDGQKCPDNADHCQPYREHADESRGHRTLRTAALLLGVDEELRDRRRTHERTNAVTATATIAGPAMSPGIHMDSTQPGRRDGSEAQLDGGRSFTELRSDGQPSAVECDDPQQQQKSRDDENSKSRPEPRSARAALRSRSANPISANGNDNSSPSQPEPRQHDDHEPPPRPPRELHRSSMPDEPDFRSRQAQNGRRARDKRWVPDAQLAFNAQPRLSLILSVSLVLFAAVTVSLGVGSLEAGFAYGWGYFPLALGALLIVGSTVWIYRRPFPVD